MPYRSDLLTDGEEILTAFRPHWKSLVIPILWTVIALTGAGLTIWLVPSGMPQVVVLAVLGLGWVVMSLLPALRWWFTIHVLTNERLIVRAGLIARRGLEIPLEAINDVIFSQTVFERLLGFGDLVIESAGEQGQSVFANIPRPEEFQSFVYKAREDRSMILSGATSGSQAADVLSKLAELHREGVISDEEFAEKKRELLEEI